MKGKIHCCFSTSEIDLHNLSDCRVVVIDIFRASTTICAALYSGMDSIHTVSKPEEALELQAQNPDLNIAAERGGERVEGFPLGNSPYDYLEKDWRNQSLVLTTSNGTKALKQSEGALEILVGGFVNLSLLSEYLKQTSGDILVFCAGWKGFPNLEDSYFAGALINELLSDFLPVDDNSTIALQLYNNHKKDPQDFLKQSTHYKRLHQKIGVRDLLLAIKKDALPVLPKYSSGKIQLD